MYWTNLLAHLKHYAAELDETGFSNEAEYVRTTLITKVLSDADQAQKRGKRILLVLLQNELTESEK